MPDRPLLGPSRPEDSSAGQPPVKAPVREAILDRVIPIAAFLARVIIPWLPRCAVVGLASVLGAAMCFFMRGRRMRIAQANLEVVFGDSLSAKAKRRVIRDSACNMVRVVLDLFWFSRHRERRLKEYVTFDLGSDESAVTLPWIVVTAHLGNWEILCQAMAMRGYQAVIP